MQVTGSCHCGKIAFEAKVDARLLQICHCLDCQVLTGSAFRVTVPALPQDFRLTKGNPKIYLKTADSGSQRRHAFCGDCGTPVYRMPTANTPTYSLRIGNLYQRLEFKRPLRQIWIERRLPWVLRIADVMEVNSQPK